MSPGSSARTGIHRSYFSRWLARYRKGGVRALETKSRSPKRKEIVVMAGKEVPTREITFARDENGEWELVKKVLLSGMPDVDGLGVREANKIMSQYWEQKRKEVLGE